MSMFVMFCPDLIDYWHSLQTVPELCDLQEQADAEEPKDAVLGSLKSMDRTPGA